MYSLSKYSKGNTEYNEANKLTHHTSFSCIMNSFPCLQPHFNVSKIHLPFSKFITFIFLMSAVLNLLTIFNCLLLEIKSISLLSQ